MDTTGWSPALPLDQPGNNNLETFVGHTQDVGPEVS